MNTRRYVRVSRALRCPICGRAKWCRIRNDGAIAVCNHVKSAEPGRDRGGGWIHRLRTPARPPLTITASDTSKMSIADATALDVRCRSDLSPRRLELLARSLGVAAHSLRRLGVGWHVESHVYTFAMRDARARIIGLHTRTPDGDKRCIKGSSMGIILPDQVDSDPRYVIVPDWLIVTEGVSDAAAALDLGFAAIARPGCQSAADILITRIREHRPARLALTADADQPGQAGAMTLARRIATEARVPTRILTLPGAKDLRAWKALPGASTHVLLSILESSAQRVTRPGCGSPGVGGGSAHG